MNYHMDYNMTKRDRKGGRKRAGLLFLICGVLLFVSVFVTVVREWLNTRNIEDILSADVNEDTVISGEISKDNLLGELSTGGLFDETEHYYFITAKDINVAAVKITDKEQIGVMNEIFDGKDETVKLSASADIMERQEKDKMSDALVKMGVCDEEVVDKILLPYVLKNYNGKLGYGTNIGFAMATLPFLTGLIMLIPEISDLIPGRKGRGRNKSVGNGGTFYGDNYGNNNQSEIMMSSKYDPNIPYSGITESEYDCMVSDSGVRGGEVNEPAYSRDTSQGQMNELEYGNDTSYNDLYGSGCDPYKDMTADDVIRDLKSKNYDDKFCNF